MGGEQYGTLEITITVGESEINIGAVFFRTATRIVRAYLNF